MSSPRISAGWDHANPLYQDLASVIPLPEHLERKFDTMQRKPKANRSQLYRVGCEIIIQLDSTRRNTNRNNISRRHPGSDINADDEATEGVFQKLLEAEASQTCSDV